MTPRPFHRDYFLSLQNLFHFLKCYLVQLFLKKEIKNGSRISYLKSCTTKPEHIHYNIEAVDWSPGKEKYEADCGQDPKLDFIEGSWKGSPKRWICWKTSQKSYYTNLHLISIEDNLELTCWSFFFLQFSSQFVAKRRLLSLAAPSQTLSIRISIFQHLYLFSDHKWWSFRITNRQWVTDTDIGSSHCDARHQKLIVHRNQMKYNDIR